MKTERSIKCVILILAVGTLLLSGCQEQSYDMEDVPNMDYTITKESTNPDL